MAAPTPSLKGITTMQWGPNNAMNAPAGAIVESISITPKNAGPIGEIEDNNGAAVTLVMLDDGFDAKATCVYDSLKAWPANGGNVALNLPIGTGSANANATSYVCLVVSQSPSLARKKETMIEFSLVYRPGVAV